MDLAARTLFSIWDLMGLVVLFLGDVSLLGSEIFLVEFVEIFEVELSFLMDNDVALVLFLEE